MLICNTTSRYGLTMFILLQVNRLGMDIQVDYFNITRKQINEILGPSKAREYVTKRSIFSITIGANDFLNNYLLPVLSIGERLSETPDQFIDHLINNLRIQLTVSSLFLSLLLDITIDSNVFYCLFDWESIYPYIMSFHDRDCTDWMLESLW